MRYLVLRTTDPYLNLAIEEYLLTYCEDDVFMLWQNEPSVVVGINQNIRAEVDTDALFRLGVKPVRRITGGGAVYHDPGNINYSFIARSGGGIDFATFSAPIIAAIGSLGVHLTLSGRNDLCLPDGRKVSGNAQCKRADRVLHHGTLLFDTDLSALGGLLTPSPEKLVTKAIKSTASRVANLKELLPDIRSADELIAIIEKYVRDNLGAVEMAPPTDEKIDKLRARNCSPEWLYPSHGISSSVTITKAKRYPFGSVRAEISLSGERVSELHIGGDFFGECDISELTDALAGRRLSELEDALKDTDVGKYVYGMTREELIELLS